MAKRGWKRQFDDPIPLPRGRQLVTLEDAAGYIMKLPKAEQDLPEWQAAIECLILVAERNGPAMMARSIATSSASLTPRAKTHIGESGSSRGTNENCADLRYHRRGSWGRRPSEGVHERRCCRRLRSQ